MDRRKEFLASLSLLLSKIQHIQQQQQACRQQNKEQDSAFNSTQLNSTQSATTQINTIQLQYKINSIMSNQPTANPLYATSEVAITPNPIGPPSTARHPASGPPDNKEEYEEIREQVSSS